MRRLFFAILWPALLSWGQGIDAPVGKSEPRPTADIERLSSTKVPTEVAGIFQDPLRCDSSGNLYFYAYSEEGHPIKKLDRKGHRLAIFSQAYIPDVHINNRRYFSIRSDDTLDDLIYASDAPDHYIATFGIGWLLPIQDQAGATVWHHAGASRRLHVGELPCQRHARRI